MKRFIQLFAVLLLSLFLAACGGQNDDSNATDNNDDTAASDQDQVQDQGQDSAQDDDNADMDDDSQNNDQTSSDSDMADKMKELDYTDFELEVSYGKNKEYEAEIEQDQNTGEIESEIEDSVIDNIDSKGKEAFDKIYPNLKKLTIDRDTTKEEAIGQALKAFDLSSDYTEFEIELTFKDNTKIEFEDKK